MKETIDAIYENGVFRPLKQPRIPHGKQVVLEVDISESGTPEEILELAASVFEGLSEGEIEEVVATTNRTDLFGSRDLQWPSK